MENLILPHGGYGKLKTFQLARLVYDLTVRFVELYIDRRSRTCDQMVQAARSGVQNIAEGSVASATSKKTELKLTNVARASLEELKLDYEDFLRQRDFEEWPPEHPALLDFRKRKVGTMEEFREWLRKVHGHTRTCTDTRGQAAAVANAALSLLNLTIYLLKKQVEQQATDFERNGGFTERLYKTRKEKRG